MAEMDAVRVVGDEDPMAMDEQVHLIVGLLAVAVAARVMWIKRKALQQAAMRQDHGMVKGSSISWSKVAPLTYSQSSLWKGFA